MTTIIALCVMLAGMLGTGFVGFCWGHSACRAQVKEKTRRAELVDFAKRAAQEAWNSRRESTVQQ